MRLLLVVERSTRAPEPRRDGIKLRIPKAENFVPLGRTATPARLLPLRRRSAGVARNPRAAQYRSLRRGDTSPATGAAAVPWTRWSDPTARRARRAWRSR